jgi:AcrR family transcriptional regulator
MDKPFNDAGLEPPWWDVHKRGESRASIDRESIVTAAIKVLDESGLDGLSMRRVAAELEAGAASLYWHIADKDQLIDLILDRLMGEIELPEPDPNRWQEQVKEFARSGREMFRRHRDVAQASLGRVPMGPNLVRLAEWVLTVLRGAGIPDREAAWFADIAALVVGAQAVEDDMATTAGPETQAAIGEYLSSLPVDRFPNLAASAEAMVTGGADDRFEFALDLLVRGLATYIEDTPG